MPNKKAPHGAFLLHRYKQSLDAMIAFQTKPEALLRFENARVFATFHTGIPTPVSMGDAVFCSQFQSTPSARRATNVFLSICWYLLISIHALREEGDPDFNLRDTYHINFNPRPPRGGRHQAAGGFQPRHKISIHALREEGDSTTGFSSTTGFYFNPRPPRGGRRGMFTRSGALLLFQSTPSARRATVNGTGKH